MAKKLDDINVNLEDVLEGDESVFDIAESRLKEMLASEDLAVQLKAISLAPRFESMRPQKKSIVLSNEMRFLVELLLSLEERFSCSAMDALRILQRSMNELEPILGRHSPRNPKNKSKK